MVKYLTKKESVAKKIVQTLSIMKYLSSHKNSISEDFLRSILTNIVGTVVTVYEIIEIMEGSELYDPKYILDIYQDIVSNNEQPVSYEELETYGFIGVNNLNVENLNIEIKLYTRKFRLNMSGFSKTKRGFDFKPIEFSKYFYSRVKIVSTSPEDFYVYTEYGIWESVDKDEVCRIITYLMNEISTIIWKPLFETQVFIAIQRTCHRIPKMNAFRNLMNLSNGMLDLNSFELLEHDEKYYSSIRIDIKYDPIAMCERFRLYMKQITCNDEKLEMVLQEILGYLLTIETRAEKAFIFYGAGSNGKSVFAKVITMICGRVNVSNIPLREFASRFGTETIVDKTVNIATETEIDDIKLNTENIKSIASGDPMHIQRKYKQGIDIEPLVKLVFLTNNLPRVNDTTKGFLRKIMIIPFNAEFNSNSKNPENRTDNKLIETLEAEKEGILMYALEGLKRLKENKFRFTECDAINEALCSYEKEINPTIEFFEDNLEISQGDYTHRPDILNKFKAWAHETGKLEWTNISPQKFWMMFEQTMAKNGMKYRTKKIGGHMKVLDLKFKQSNVLEDNLDNLIFEFGE